MVMDNKKSSEVAEKTMEELSKSSTLKYTLSRKVKVGGDEYSELTLNFDNLTGEDMEAVAALPGCNSGDMNVNEFSKTYLLNIAARAAGININIMRKFPIADCTALTMKAQAFLMGAVSKVIAD
jgi:hypothetical protein